MINKKVCPNCGQLYDPDLAKCPLCGQAPQVVETEKPVQRHRITEAERRQRRAERKDAELEARRRRKDEQLARDAEEERLLEEEEALRREERRRLREEKKAQRQQKKQGDAPRKTAAAPEPAPAKPARKSVEEKLPSADPIPTPVVTPGPVRTKQRPEMQEKAPIKDRGRVPRVFLVLCTLILLATLVVGGTYLAWKLGAVKLPIYDKLAAAKEAAESTAPAGNVEPSQTEATEVNCRSLSLSQSSYEFFREGDTVQITVQTDPEGLVETYASSDESVVIVGESGLITAVAPGTAVVTVSCGNKQAECQITCRWETVETTVPPELPDGDLELFMEDMTFFEAGESFVQTVKNIPVGTTVVWSSLDETVATVDATGHIKAVGPGETKVIAAVGDKTGSCIVRCKFKGDDE